MIQTREQGIETMLAEIDAEARITRRMTGRPGIDARIMDVMAKVPRDAFVPEALRAAAFDNGPLPIGHGQTISQPFIVALMTDLLAPRPTHRVLEIGTGTGYQTAVLSLLCDSVYSVDRIAALSETAAARLERLGFHNVHIRTGDGHAGWPEFAPYDRVIVTAAATHVPAALVDQLRPGGRLVIPVGPPHGPQSLLLVNKDAAGQSEVQDVLGVAFVPLVADDERR